MKTPAQKSGSQESVAPGDWFWGFRFGASLPSPLAKSLGLGTWYLVLSLSTAASAAEPFQGRIEATLTRGGTEASHFVFTRKGNQLRIENTSNKLEPINIVDLAGKRLTIVYPHNTTFVHVDLTKKQSQPTFLGKSPGMPPMQGSASAGAGVIQSGSSSPATTAQVGPNFSSLPSPPPAFSSPPSMPPIPQTGGSVGEPSALPNPMQMSSAPPMPPGVGRNAATSSGPGMPGMANLAGGMPSLPSTAGMFGTPELKKRDQTKKIHGFDCTLYTIASRGETFEIWATNDSSLIPFRLIERDYLGRRFGPQILDEIWPELLRNRSLFPIEATLKMDLDGRERLSFKIDKIEADKRGLKIDDKLFQPPEKYVEIQAPDS